MAHVRIVFQSIKFVTANGFDGVMRRWETESPGLYVDGKYQAIEKLLPYTFTWNATGLDGRHELIAKAYVLQIGTESVSLPVQIMIAPCWALEVNSDSRVDLKVVTVLQNAFTAP